MDQSDFIETSPENGQIGSRFGLVFLEFWSGFSLDFTLFGLEIKVGALDGVWKAV